MILGIRSFTSWLIWLAVLIVLTIVMHGVRQDIEEAHVVIPYLLVVLGGSATGGRALGFTLAGLSFLLIDYYFQVPFDTLSVGKPLDWVASSRRPRLRRSCSPARRTRRGRPNAELVKSRSCLASPSTPRRCERRTA